MTGKTVLFLIVLFAVSACTPAQQESLIKSAEQNALNDSLRRKAEMKVLKDRIQAFSDSVISIEKEIDSVSVAIGLAKAEYQVQNDQLEKIKKFKLLRSKDEREQQIRSQSDVLYAIEKHISALEYQLVNLQVRLDYFKSEMNKSSLIN